jgi:hypothetical protein
VSRFHVSANSSAQVYQVLQPVFAQLRLLLLGLLLLVLLPATFCIPGHIYPALCISSETRALALPKARPAILELDFLSSNSRVKHDIFATPDLRSLDDVTLRTRCLATAQDQAGFCGVMQRGSNHGSKA